VIQFTQYQLVRIRYLLHATDTYNGWGFNICSPQVGDIGTIVDILQACGLRDSYIVEAVQPDGTTLWLGDFVAEELEAIEEQVDGSNDHSL
jgi:hypothetical protein